jgi:hypothetical protein
MNGKMAYEKKPKAQPFSSLFANFIKEDRSRLYRLPENALACKLRGTRDNRTLKVNTG